MRCGTRPGPVSSSTTQRVPSTMSERFKTKSPLDNFLNQLDQYYKSYDSESIGYMFSQAYIQQIDLKGSLQARQMVMTHNKAY
jgi:hypothetical protein